MSLFFSQHRYLLIALGWCSLLAAMVIGGIFAVKANSMPGTRVSLPRISPYLFLSSQKLCEVPRLSEASAFTFTGALPELEEKSSKPKQPGMLKDGGAVPKQYAASPDVSYGEPPLFSLEGVFSPVLLRPMGKKASDYSSLIISSAPRPVFSIKIATPETSPVEEAILIDPAWIPLINRLAHDGFDAAAVAEVFAGLGPDSFCPDFMAAKVTELFGVGNQFIAARRAEDPLLPIDYVRPIPEVTASNCVYFMETYKEQLADIQKVYGVPDDIIMGILLIETALGTNLGQYSALQALASMAVTATPGMLAPGGSRQTKAISAAALQRTLTDKSEWAYQEVKALIAYALKTGRPAYSVPGSMYGAIGLCQFMPSNIDIFGADGDGDGVIDLFAPVDAMYSVARYLHENGWNSSASRNRKLQVVYTYNHDWSYASNVLAVANQITLAKKGKVAALSNPLGAASGGRGYVDRYLKKRRHYIPARARIKELGSYSNLVQ